MYCFFVVVLRGLEWCLYIVGFKILLINELNSFGFKNSFIKKLFDKFLVKVFLLRDIFFIYFVKLFSV